MKSQLSAYVKLCLSSSCEFHLTAMYIPIEASFHHSPYDGPTFLLQVEHAVLTAGKNTLLKPNKLKKIYTLKNQCSWSRAMLPW